MSVFTPALTMDHVTVLANKRSTTELILFLASVMSVFEEDLLRILETLFEAAIPFLSF